MRRFLAWLKRQLARYGRYMAHPYHAFFFVRDLVREGGHAISTPFEYAQQQFGFRTVIHLDGSINHFIPNFTGYTYARAWVDTTHDPRWQALFHQHLRLHRQQVDEFIAAIQHYADTSQHAITVLLTTCNVASLGWGLWKFEEGYVFGSAALTLYTLFLRQYTSGLLVQGLWFVMRRLSLGQRVLNKLLAKVGAKA
jgi:hypothetical protein